MTLNQGGIPDINGLETLIGSDVKAELSGRLADLTMGQCRSVVVSPLPIKCAPLPSLAGPSALACQ